MASLCWLLVCALCAGLATAQFKLQDPKCQSLFDSLYAEPVRTVQGVTGIKAKYTEPGKQGIRVELTPTKEEKSKLDFLFENEFEPAEWFLSHNFWNFVHPKYYPEKYRTLQASTKKWLAETKLRASSMQLYQLYLAGESDEAVRTSLPYYVRRCNIANGPVKEWMDEMGNGREDTSNIPVSMISQDRANPDFFRFLAATDNGKNTYHLLKEIGMFPYKVTVDLIANDIRVWAAPRPSVYTRTSCPSFYTRAFPYDYIQTVAGLKVTAGVETYLDRHWKKAYQAEKKRLEELEKAKKLEN